MTHQSTVDMTPLKRLALKRLPPASALREVILNEPDEISSSEYIAKLPIWQKLLKIET
jgi:hypothetical protein